MSYFKKVVAVPSLSKTGAQLDFGGLREGNAWLALITFLYVDFFDTTGTLFSMANFVGTYLPGWPIQAGTACSTLLRFARLGQTVCMSLLGPQLDRSLSGGLQQRIPRAPRACLAISCHLLLTRA